ncbi:MAG: toxin [Flexilinea sp.]
MQDLSNPDFRRSICNFLIDFKKVMDEGLRYSVLKREKNRQALIDLGITNKIRDEIIKTLSIEDYSSGPTKDIYHQGYYWVFGKDIDGKEVYIKLIIQTDSQGEDWATCYSFHPNEENPLKYPFRKSAK